MNPIIVKFYAEGHITKEAAARLDKFDQLVKEADWKSTVLKSVLTAAIPAAGFFGGQYAWEHFGKNRLKEEDMASAVALQNTFNSLKSDPNFRDNPVAHTRFNQLA
ncbi:MAG: hypothetical protein DRI46_10815, partial [Chloroflexi bacterium]